MIVRVAVLVAMTMVAGCSAPQPPAPAQPPHARHLILITIDTMRADRLGTYGYARARTPNMDAIARRGVRFDRAFATAPITLPSHASMMTGRYPPGHGSRHNGIRIDPKVPVLAETLASSGFATGAFVGAFPLDRRFGLDRGFTAYGDRMERRVRGRPDNERPGRVVVDEALAWLETTRTRRVFLWIHLFEPHAPYGDAGTGGTVENRYDAEIAEADTQIGRVTERLGAELTSSLVVVASDHGEAFGEHGEVSHSVFVYDTTLRVPWIMAGPGVPSRSISDPVSLVDLPATVLPLLGLKPFDSDGVNLAQAFSGDGLSSRDLYAESFAPLLDFGWSPLRSLRSNGLKYIDAPRPELYDTAQDPGETRDVAKANTARVAALKDRVERYSPPAIDPPALDRDALARLQALGYVGSGAKGGAGSKADPKDRRELAARISEVTSGELQGVALEKALQQILEEDQNNPQANLRLGYVLLESGRCDAAVRHLKTAIAGRLPSADAHLGLAMCAVAAKRLRDAESTLRDAERIEPDNPVVLANLGIVVSDAGQHASAIAPLERALAIDPNFHEARFHLARVLARAGRRQDAAREAQELLNRLPADAPQRSEVTRLLNALR